MVLLKIVDLVQLDIFVQQKVQPQHLVLLDRMLSTYNKKFVPVVQMVFTVHRAHQTIHNTLVFLDTTALVVPNMLGNTHALQAHTTTQQGLGMLLLVCLVHQENSVT